MAEDRDYLFIQPWMFDLFESKEKSKGKGTDYIKVLIFAYIYSFSRDGNSKWYGRQQTLAKMVHASESVVCKKLKELVNDGFIECERIECYGMFHHNNYKVSENCLRINTVALETTMVVSETTNNKSNYNSLNTTTMEVKNESSSNAQRALDDTHFNDSSSYNNKYSEPAPPTAAPTAEQCRNFALVKGLGKNELFEQINWQHFVDYYNALDWVDSNGKQIDWRRKVVSWVNNQRPEEVKKYSKKYTKKSNSVSYKYNEPSDRTGGVYEW